MSDTVIKVENLSKRYRIGAKEGYKTFRETLVDAAKAPIGKLSRLFNRTSDLRPQTSDSIWALKDVSFEVRRGEVVGIIGRNGAGKSTLLKILSKITEPTSGRVELRGRVGSLLEVGTGFHPELTGHENIYLYGAILGMDRFEVTRKFDEIVAFAELEKFIDTPVKRYSSGMYMRLAFAVAAHLEPEILLVDEVLAVGDAEFQKKCLGKMDDVSKGGRTVLFVSHNMQAIQSLCKTTIRLHEGRIVASGDPILVVSGYLASATGMASEISWAESSAPGNDEIRLLYISISDETGSSQGVFSSSKDILVEMGFFANVLHPSLCVGYDLLSLNGEVVARSYQTDLSPEEWPVLRKGENRWCCVIPKGFLNGGVYYIVPRIGMHNMYWIVTMDSAVRFEVVLDHGLSPFWNALDGKNRPGVVAPIFRWHSKH
ncbi:ATP-binding cassette domain-containing protein [Candidatus Parcubacteria bacterium]|nr:MAG: ATP-binding cassette domain-containing protein [Candidatus Parcubacteria bacterium]